MGKMQILSLCRGTQGLQYIILNATYILVLDSLYIVVEGISNRPRDDIGTHWGFVGTQDLSAGLLP